MRKEPNPAFEAPTYEDRDASFFPARQGGSHILAKRPYLLFIVLTVRACGWIIIDFKNLLRDISPTIFSLSPILYDLEMVNHIDSRMKHKFALPSL